MWRGPREQVWGAAGEAGLMPAFVSISDTKYFAHNTQGETILSQLISDEPRDGDIDRDSNVPDTCPQGTIYTVFCPDILQSPDTGWGQGEVILMIFTAPVSWTNQS